VDLPYRVDTKIPITIPGGAFLKMNDNTAVFRVDSGLYKVVCRKFEE